MATSRRNFLKLGALATAASIFADNSAFAESRVSENLPEKDLKFLFQGDSITDGNRGRSADPNHIMGHGYAFSVASRLAADFPAKDWQFYNRGISGNKIPDLQKRWQTDTLDLNPDVLSLLIGINDVHAIVNQSESRQTADEFAEGYRDLLRQTKAANSKVLFVLGLPFVYPVGNVKKNLVLWQEETGKRAEKVRQIAAEYNAVLVDYPAVFDKALKLKSAEYWIWDGIHPTIAGHELMAREWIKQVSGRISALKRYKY